MNTQTLQMYRDTVQQDNDNYIAIKPICELFGIDYRRQSEFIRTNEFLSTTVLKKELRLPQGGGNKLQLCLSKTGFIFWIFQLNSKILKDDLKEKFLNFQSNLLEFMYANTEGRISTLKHKLNIQREISRTVELLEQNPDYKKLMDLQAEQMRIGKEIKEYDRHILNPSLFGDAD